MQWLKNILNSEDTKSVLFQCLLISGIMHFVAVILSDGYHRPDEHLGMMRYVAYKLGIVPESELSWEYGAQIRPWLQPYIYIVVSKFFRIFTEDTFYLATFLRFFSSALAFGSIYLFIKNALRFLDTKRAKNIMILGTCTLWYLPFFHARTTTENFGISFFLFGLYPILRSIPRKHLLSQKIEPLLKDKTWGISNLESIFVGLLLSCSFIFRFQMSVSIFFLLAWLLVFSKIRIQSLVIITAAIFALIGFNTYLDFLGHGEWTFTPWNYVYQNIFKGVASGFGVSPWYYYFTKTLAKGTPPFSLLLILPMLWIWVKKPLHIITWITLPYLIVHSMIGHKELRFVFALGTFAPLILAIFTENFNVDRFLVKKWVKVLLIICAIENFGGLIIASVKPAYSPLAYYKHLYKKEVQPSKVYTLGVFRDQLKFYLRSPLEEVVIEHKDILPTIGKENKTVWFLTDKFSDVEFFRNHKHLCKEDYLSYPSWVINDTTKKWLKRSKIWALYKCKR